MPTAYTQIKKARKSRLMTDDLMLPGFYNMDCMSAMQTFPDKFFDLAIVDPPYGGGDARRVYV